VALFKAIHPFPLFPRYFSLTLACFRLVKPRPRINSFLSSSCFLNWGFSSLFALLKAPSITPNAAR